jgi:DMSO/TMAO reductase YedYZ molybdopterin-dependent catalytic subunit
MKMNRRKAIFTSGAVAAALSMGVLKPEEIVGQPQAQPQSGSGDLTTAPIRNIAPLPLNPDGSAPEHPESAAGPIEGQTLWRYTNNQPPAIEYDYRKMQIRVDTRGGARLTGALRWENLEPLPRRSAVYLLQCGAPTPKGIVKWTGVRFSDFAEMLGMQSFTHYCRVIGHDNFWAEEDMKTVMHPQVMLAWMMNDQPLTPAHGAPIRLIIPFRYGARSVKAIKEIVFATTGFPLPTLPPA